MKKRILVVGPAMELGGVERSLIGLLDSFDFETVDVDLFLYAHKGVLLDHINSNVNLLPEIELFSCFFKDKDQLVREGHFFVLILKLISKLIAKYHKFRGCGEDGKDTYLRIASEIAIFQSKHYELALGFIDPFFFEEKKVNADFTIGWAHTDWNLLCSQGKYTPAPRVWEKVDRVACVSDGVKKGFDCLYPQYVNKTIVIENILPAKYVKKQAEEFPVDNEMPGDQFRILSVGRFTEQKNFIEAIEAGKIMHDKGLAFRWYFIGFGPQEQEMSDMVKRMGAEKYIIILGKKANPYPYMKACDLYVQPSIYEGKAVTVREAQMLGKPVVITNFPSAASQLENGVDGIIIPLSLEGIVEGITYMMEHPEVRDRIGKNCLDRDYSNANELEKILSYVGKQNDICEAD